MKELLKIILCLAVLFSCLVIARFVIASPDTATFDNPTEDGCITSSFGRDSTGIRIRIDSITSYIGYVEWDISSIPDNSIITDVVFKYHGEQGYLDCHVREMLGARPSTSSNEAVFNEASEGTVYYNTPGFPAVGTNRQVDLGTDADSDLQSQLSEDWFAIGIQVISPGEDYSRIWSEEWGDATPNPTLYVVYEEDPCSCPGLNNDWEIDMSDNCQINDNCDLGTGTLSFTGSGYVNCNASINTTDLGDPGSAGILYIQGSCLITVD